MALSSDNVKTIRLIADKLEKWVESLSYSVSPTVNLWVELTLSLYPQDVHGIASWLDNIPTTGQQISKELEELSELVQKVDAWRNHGVYAEDLGDFCACINRLKNIIRSLISNLRNISGSGEPKQSETKSETVEKSNAPKKPQPASAMAVSKEALMAYKLRYEAGLNMKQVAKRMTCELKLDKALRTWQISRWIKQVESQFKRSRMPIRSIAPKAAGNIPKSTKTDAMKT